MPLADEPREGALRRLDERAAALGARTQRPAHSAAGEQAVSQAYRIIAELIGGVVVGLAGGFFVVWAFKVPTALGLIGGVLLGFALSLWMAWRTAERLMALARQDGEPRAVPLTDDDEE